MILVLGWKMQLKNICGMNSVNFRNIVTFAFKKKEADILNVKFISYLWSGMYLSNSFAMEKMQQKVTFEAGYSWFEFRIIFLSDWFPNKG